MKKAVAFINRNILKADKITASIYGIFKQRVTQIVAPCNVKRIDKNLLIKGNNDVFLINGSKSSFEHHMASYIIHMGINHVEGGFIEAVTVIDTDVGRATAV